MNSHFRGRALAALTLAAALNLQMRETPAATQDSGAIQPWPENRFYWQFEGHPVFLAGGSDDDNLFQWPKERLVKQLDLLVACGGNYVRNTMSDRRDKGFELYPFKQLANGKYDLEQWNDEYWERFDTFLDETARRKIIVQIEVWDRFDYSGANWPPHPYNPKNNINYTAESSGLEAVYPEHAGRNRQPFFYTVPELRNNEVLLRYQRRFVDRMLSSTLKHSHVLYCMDNETSGAPEWGAHWARYIKQRAKEAGRRVYVTEMWDSWDLKSEEHRRTFDHPELYDFVDVSQNNHKKGQEHWDNFQWVRRHLKGAPRPINTVKTYGADGNKFGHTDQDGLERVWRHVLGGAASVRFHRPDSGLGLSEKAQSTLRSIRLLEGRVPLWELEAGSGRLNGREANEAYLACKPDDAYVVYFPRGGSVKLDLREAKGSFLLQWLDISEARLSRGEQVRGGREVPLSPRGDGMWLAILSRR